MKMSSLLFGLMTCVLSASVLAAEPIVIKFSHVVAQETPKGMAANYFAKRWMS